MGSVVVSELVSVVVSAMVSAVFNTTISILVVFIDLITKQYLNALC